MAVIRTDDILDGDTGIDIVILNFARSSNNITITFL